MIPSLRYNPSQARLPDSCSPWQAMVFTSWYGPRLGPRTPSPCRGARRSRVGNLGPRLGDMTTPQKSPRRDSQGCRLKAVLHAYFRYKVAAEASSTLMTFGRRHHLESIGSLLALLQTEMASLCASPLDQDSGGNADNYPRSQPPHPGPRTSCSDPFHELPVLVDIWTFDADDRP